MRCETLLTSSTASWFPSVLKNSRILRSVTIWKNSKLAVKFIRELRHFSATQVRGQAEHNLKTSVESKSSDKTWKSFGVDYLACWVAYHGFTSMKMLVSNIHLIFGENLFHCLLKPRSWGRVLRWKQKQFCLLESIIYRILNTTQLAMCTFKMKKIDVQPEYVLLSTCVTGCN